jgi:hypothetical protein
MERPCNPIAPLAFSLLAAVLLCGSALADDTAAAREPGIWQKHEYSFAYMGFTTTYSCDGLADKLKRLLLAAGARKDVKSRPGACAAGFGSPDKFARADLVFYTLAPVDASAAPGDKRVEGSWRPVAFSARSPRELALGDCELVEQFRSTVVPMFATRNLDNRTTCVPHQLSGSTINLKFESFVATSGP